jgi:hypothetical protein
MKNILVFSFAFIISSVQGNILRCDLRHGGQGQCMPIRDCEMVKTPNFVFYPDHFCSEDFSLICCDMTITSTNRMLPTTTTTKAPLINPSSSVQNFENHSSFKLFDMETCGPVLTSAKIAGGDNAQILEFPWNVLIGYDINGETQFWCGGTLISGKLKNSK